MNQPDMKQEGIVPSIMRMREFLNELVEAFQTFRSGDLSEEKVLEIEQKITLYAAEITELPDTVTKSYELIQSVILSIHNSRSELKKSVDGLIKKTGVQLKKVTSTTEEATNKILDVAEKLDEDQMKIIALVDDLEAGNSTGDKEGSTARYEDIRSKIYQNQESAFLIMDYLQFQDITAQQIAGAYSLLSDTEKTLLYVSDLLHRFDSNREALASVMHDADKRSFNEDASFSDKKVMQDAIDDLFASGDVNTEIPTEQKKEETAKPEAEQSDTGGAFQDDIDALFSQGSANGADSASQDDIDALFNSDKKEEASQDDIDKLFS
ncbi:MAG: hypothetical protein K8R90_00800 [Candidatus Cloacimonetes bacterium]|nr:hypothetical protein [Candidatus Cloacimonadota bacterium]